MLEGFMRILVGSVGWEREPGLYWFVASTVRSPSTNTPAAWYSLVFISLGEQTTP